MEDILNFLPTVMFRGTPCISSFLKFYWRYSDIYPVFKIPLEGFGYLSSSLNSTGGTQIYTLFKNSTGGIQISFLWVYHSTGGIRHLSMGFF